MSNRQRGTVLLLLGYTLTTMGLIVAGLTLGFLLPLVFLILPLFLLPIFFLFYVFSMRVNNRSDLEQIGLQKSATLTAVLHELRVPATARRKPSPMDALKKMPNPLKLFEKIKWQSAQKQIEQITSVNFLQIVDLMPSDGTVVQHFSPGARNQWVYRFQFKSLAAEFSATGVGEYPLDAFMDAKNILLRQIQIWHIVRNQNEFYVGNEQVLSERKMAIVTEKPVFLANQNAPTVLIVEDDVDVAGPVEAIFKKLGCRTIVSNGRDGASHKMSFQNIDFIFLDWVLGDDLNAGELVKKSSRIIETFQDLREYFKRQHTKIITYSALSREKAQLPENNYFQHLDHWQKPINYENFTLRARQLLTANGY